MIKLKLLTHVSLPRKNFNNRIFSRVYLYSLDGAHINIENINKKVSNNLDFYSFKNFIKNILDSYNIKSVISKKYLEYLKIDNDEFDFIR